MSRLRSYIDRIRRSKDGKTLVANFGYLTLLQVASYLFPLITMPYLARVIGVDGFGKIAFASAIITWFQTITDWGFNYTATRDVAKNRDNTDEVSKIFSTVFWARCTLMIISLIILLILVAFIPIFRENVAVILITFLLIPGHIMFPDWFFQALEKMQYITIFNIVIRLFFTVAVFVCIKSADDYLIQPLLVSLGYLLSGAIALYVIMHKWHYRLHKSSAKDIFTTIRRSTDVFLNNLMPNLYNSFSVILLGMFGGQVANGLLDAGSKFVNLLQQFVSVLSRTFFPYLSRNIDKHKVYVQLNLAISLCASVALFVMADWLIGLFFTEAFAGAVLILRIMSVSILFNALSNIYGTNYLIIVGQEKALRNMTMLASVIGFAISFPLIYFYGAIGAAITITATRGVLGLFIMLKAKSIA